MDRYKDDLVKPFDFYITIPYVVPWLVVPYTCGRCNSQHQARIAFPPPNRDGASCLICTCMVCNRLTVGLAYSSPDLSPIIYDRDWVPIGYIQLQRESEN